MNRFAVVALLAVAAATAQAQQRAADAPAAPAGPGAAVFKAWDRNGDGALTPAEFDAGWRQAQDAARARMALQRRFAALDRNHDGAIDAGEYRDLALARDPGGASLPLARFDASGNGALDFAEYVALVGTLAPQREAGGGHAK